MTGKLEHIEYHDLMKKIASIDAGKLVSSRILEQILDANNLWYEKGVIRTKFDQPILSEDDVHSFVENLKWHYDDVFVLYGHEVIVVKGRSVGATTLSFMQDKIHSILAIHNMSLDKFVDIYQRSLRLKAFL